MKSNVFIFVAVQFLIALVGVNAQTLEDQHTISIPKSLTDDSWIAYQMFTPEDAGHITSLAVDSEGTVWIGCYLSLQGDPSTANLRFYKDGAWSGFGYADGVMQMNITDIAIEADDTVWAAVSGDPLLTPQGNGVCCYDGVELSSYPVPSGGSNFIVEALADGRILLGNGHHMLGNAIMCLDETGWTEYSESLSSQYNQAQVIAAVGDNAWAYCSYFDIHMGARGGVFYTLSDNQWQRMDDIPHEGTSVRDILQDGNGTVWLLTSSNELISYKDDTWTSHSGEAGLPDGDMFCLATDPDGEIMIGTAGSVIQRSGEDWKIYYLGQDTPVKDISMHPDGSIWMITQFDVIRFLPEEATAVEEQQTSPTAIALTGTYPNPFNPTTTIVYSLEQTCNPIFTIYSVTGQKVRSFRPGSVSVGQHTLVWDSTDEIGNPVASGTYICQMEVGRMVHTTAMTLVR